MKQGDVEMVGVCVENVYVWYLEKIHFYLFFIYLFFFCKVEVEIASSVLLSGVVYFVCVCVCVRYQQQLAMQMIAKGVDLSAIELK